jgi:hypothetical protein
MVDFFQMKQTKKPSYFKKMALGFVVTVAGP